MPNFSIVLFFCCLVCHLLLISCSEVEVKTPPNVLFIAVDDLRPELGCYGVDGIKSPNIDKLASGGVVFERAYCQQAVCMASRASLLTGIRADTLGIYNQGSVNELAPDVLTLNRHFEENGYTIWTTGKIYHHKIDEEVQFGAKRKLPPTEAFGRGYLDEKSIQIVEEFAGVYAEFENSIKVLSPGRGPAYESPDVPDNAYLDGAMTDLAIEQIKKIKDLKNPFFISIGYKKPHLPFNAPKKYWDMYDASKIAAAINPYLPENGSNYLINYPFWELRNYAGIPKGSQSFPDSLKRILKHGYFACVSYVDAQIGRLISALEEAGLDEHTVIVLWGDHGWKLGEHNMWCKHTPFEVDAHVPLIIKSPISKAKGKKTDALVEFVDIYPTLNELCGLSQPTHLQGASMVPLLNNPERKWKEGAITIWPYVIGKPDDPIIGFSIKTDRYRYTEWVQQSTGTVMETDLFDHMVDPDENNSIAHLDEHKKIIEQLSKLLDKGRGWRKIRENLQVH